MTEDDLYGLFLKCRTISKRSTYRAKIACILLDHSTRIGHGYNQVKSHPKYTTGIKKTIHAEVSAILSTRKEQVPGATAIVYREVKGKPSLAKPCKYCMEELKKFGVRKLIYSTDIYPHFIMEVIG